jgi:tRNA(adenine34) deaminase
MKSLGFSDSDEGHMRRSLQLARMAGERGEVPVGAVLVKDEMVIGEGFNCPIGQNDPTAHAEIQAIRAGARRTGNYRLTDSVLYVSVEPCVMCAGAIVMARIGRLVFAARDLRFGAVRSKFLVADSELLNHRVAVDEGLFGAEAAEILADFFRLRRDQEYEIKKGSSSEPPRT